MSSCGLGAAFATVVSSVHSGDVGPRRRSLARCARRPALSGHLGVWGPLGMSAVWASSSRPSSPSLGRLAVRRRGLRPLRSSCAARRIRSCLLRESRWRSVIVVSNMRRVVLRLSSWTSIAGSQAHRRKAREVAPHLHKGRRRDPASRGSIAPSSTRGEISATLPSSQRTPRWFRLGLRVRPSHSAPSPSRPCSGLGISVFGIRLALRGLWCRLGWV